MPTIPRHLSTILCLNDGQEGELRRQSVGRLDPLVRPTSRANDAIVGQQEGDTRPAKRVSASWQHYWLSLCLKSKEVRANYRYET